MVRSRNRLISTFLSAVLVLLTASGWAPPAAGAEAGYTVGRLLVATKEMPDPSFAQTVIYMIEHSDEGALGIVLNRPFGAISVAKLYDRMGLESDGIEGEVEVHLGGPVEPGTVFILHSDDYASDETAVLPDGLAVTTHPNILAKIADGSGPSSYLFALGYSGWGPGQLEQEMATGSWIDVELERELLFDTEDRSKWEKAVALFVIEL